VSGQDPDCDVFVAGDRVVRVGFPSVILTVVTPPRVCGAASCASSHRCTEVRYPDGFVVNVDGAQLAFAPHDADAAAQCGGCSTDVTVDVRVSGVTGDVLSINAVPAGWGVMIRHGLLEALCPECLSGRGRE